MFNTGVKMTRQEKRRHVDAWMKSGVDRDEYAAQHELNASSFRRWITNYAYLGREASPVTVRSLVPVQINSATIVRVECPSGRVWMFPADINPDWIKSVLLRIE